MSDKKQTAVEWLVNELEAHHVFQDIKNTGAFQIAKQMEKQQVINAHLTGLIHPLEMEATKQAEQYYNDNFGVQ